MKTPKRSARKKITKARKATPPRARAKKPNPAAQALGRLGGLARKRNLSPERASELGRRAAAARHGKPWPPPVVVADSAPPATPEPTV